MKVLMCATGQTPQMEKLITQLEQSGIEHEWGAPKYNGEWRNIYKIPWYIQTLGGMPHDEKVVLTDAWDVDYQGNKHILESLIPTDFILVSGEKNCFPADKQIHFPMGPTPWMFVNSGGIAGTAGNLHEFLTKGVMLYKKIYGPNMGISDQRIISRLFLLQKRLGLTKMVIDYNCRIFQSMFLKWKDEFDVDTDGALINLRTKSKPFFIHYNGQE